MHVGHPYKQEKFDERFDTIVIGSGLGGLTTAALLARHAGQRVLVLERHYTAGGFTHVFRRPGWEWDVGVHYVGQVHKADGEARALFDHLTDGRLTWSPMPDVYDRIRIADRTYDFPSGVERFREQMKIYFPSQTSAIDRYLATIFAALRWNPLYMAEKAVPAWISRVAGGIMRWPFLRYAKRTTAEVMRTITRDPELTAVLTGQWGDYGLPPARSSFVSHALVVGHYLGGASFPIGGAEQIAGGIVPVIEEAGGRVVINAEATSILLEGDRAVGVRMADGREIRASNVVSDAGAANTFMRLLPVENPRSRAMLSTLRAVGSSMSHLCLYVGVEQPSIEGAGSNLWVYGGPEHDARVARFLEDPMDEIPLMFISFPSAKDPTFAARYPGKSTVEVVAPASYEWFRRWEQTRWKKRGDDYDALKASLSARLLEGLQQHVPQLRGRIDYHELSTPLSTRHFAHYAEGEIYGLEQTPRRFIARNLTPRTPYRGLYLTGSDVCVSGLMGALMGGVMSASSMLGRNLLSAALGAKRTAGTQAIRPPRAGVSSAV